MNCWKSININKDYGIQRLIILSFIISFCYFVIFYVALSLLFPKVHYNQVGFSYLAFLMLLVFPLHKILHCLPVWLMGKKAYLLIKFENYMFPMIYCKYPTVLPKGISLAAALTPTLLVTGLSVLGCFLFPAYIPLFAIFSSLNMALGITDAIYVIHLWKAPRSSFLEDNYFSFHILTKELS